jgi:thioredoxin reductase (NADPH)
VTGETTEIEADGLFVAVGTTRTRRSSSTGSTTTRRVPRHGAALDDDEHPGVFAAGDVQDHTYRQAVTAAGSGRWRPSTRSAGSRSSATGTEVEAVPA